MQLIIYVYYKLNGVKKKVLQFRSDVSFFFDANAMNKYKFRK